MAIECEDQELLDGFLTETAELLEKLDDDLVALEKTPSDAELMNGIFRSIHTVKGASSFLGFELLVKVTHKTEDVLNRMRRGELEVTPEVMDVILEAVDLVKLLVSDIKGGDIVEREIDGTVGKLLPFLSENAKEATVLKPSATTVTPSAPAEAAPTPQATETETHPSAELSPAPEAAPVKAPEPAPRVQAPPPPAPRDDKKGDDLADNTTVRVDVKRLDDLMNQVGELVLERNRMMQLNTDFNDGGDDTFGEEFGKLSKRISFVTSELQMQVLKMRMIPVEKVFKKFPRIVRNLARDLGKEVDLLVFGEETELDRSVVDEIGDPLIHLIRNAMDHGLETPDERMAAGKPRKGTLILSAAHEGNQIVISIKDDGKGIDPERIARKAKEKGLVTDEQLAAMGQREILDLIFLPGFSTKEKATDLSGRGVGMDVVRTNIKKLNGIIDIRSELGQGSEFILKLPLTLAIIQSLLVEVEDETYSIPLAAVLETLRVEEREFHTIGGQEVLKLRDSVLPLMRLQKIFNVAPSERSRVACYVVVVGVAEKRVGLVVSRLLGQQEVAIKSLGKYLANLPGIAGSTILGDGRVTLIIDPAGLMENSDGSGGGRIAA
ncbi:CheA signal transduction histidine kinase [Geobacter metallireducens RCH3]|uniref:histidine kinase n=1 Tax=Geobacter metallireducens (strain ATCC 53774 / DSM 7210 / GS-15) TaxID=269799 RepID=Q39QJ5_GEOMG|nr:chemotaxis protein CheA [Geobacter metallireducens]ABB33479.1 sensor histidine kinase CheA associated with MCPs of classes 40H and 40+24H [Geobacter metallireducens GS-15]EHP87530.1 CheA signal transduction histidine kinase [Geobacter metallireducens RCH3]